MTQDPHPDIEKVLISADDIHEMIARLAKQITDEKGIITGSAPPVRLELRSPDA